MPFRPRAPAFAALLAAAAAATGFVTTTRLLDGAVAELGGAVADLGAGFDRDPHAEDRP
jgi:hypothetical protein